MIFWKCFYRFSKPCTVLRSNDIFFAKESGYSLILVLIDLDLTAALNTVDHNISLSRLEHWVSIKGLALEFFRSCLLERSFCVSMGCVVLSASAQWSASGLYPGASFIHAALAPPGFYF